MNFYEEFAMNEFNKNRKIILRNVPPITYDQVKHFMGRFTVANISISKRLRHSIIDLKYGHEAEQAVSELCCKKLLGCAIDVSLYRNDNLLCIADLPADMNQEKFRLLVEPHGSIEKCFLKYNKDGEFLGYGFVEYMHNREKSEQARQLLDHIKLSNHTTRCTFVKDHVTTYNQLKSSCLFFSGLPVTYTTEKLNLLVQSVESNCQLVNCQVGMSSLDPHEKFGAVEFKSEAEAWCTMKKLNCINTNNITTNNNNCNNPKIFVSFCAPGDKVDDVMKILQEFMTVFDYIKNILAVDGGQSKVMNNKSRNKRFSLDHPYNTRNNPNNNNNNKYKQFNNNNKTNNSNNNNSNNNNIDSLHFQLALLSIMLSVQQLNVPTADLQTCHNASQPMAINVPSCHVPVPNNAACYDGCESDLSIVIQMLNQRSAQQQQQPHTSIFPCLPHIQSAHAQQQTTTQSVKSNFVFTQAAVPTSTQNSFPHSVFQPKFSKNSLSEIIQHVPAGKLNPDCCSQADISNSDSSRCSGDQLNDHFLAEPASTTQQSQRTSEAHAVGSCKKSFPHGVQRAIVKTTGLFTNNSDKKKNKSYRPKVSEQIVETLGAIGAIQGRKDTNSDKKENINIDDNTINKNKTSCRSVCKNAELSKNGISSSDKTSNSSSCDASTDSSSNNEKASTDSCTDGNDIASNNGCDINDKISNSTIITSDDDNLYTAFDSNKLKFEASPITKNTKDSFIWRSTLTPNNKRTFDKVEGDGEEEDEDIVDVVFKKVISEDSTSSSASSSSASSSIICNEDSGDKPQLVGAFSKIICRPRSRHRFVYSSPRAINLNSKHHQSSDDFKINFGDITRMTSPSSAETLKFLQSPEPSPDGSYVGQHSQGLGGHYEESIIKKKKMKFRQIFPDLY
ncbi:hypothetical protein HELRODRAFT_189665 [Helobdella robusta]|uniref:RRM domain-containing protein n=1 Tax=Helobdella robusta TaxID=6412 RepID=T1FR87_HELRO|nr:hypothetical protein HELRODRAFT_189665 [Helobdella robusta]ESN93046.1 hypothetical protein HELRODRAFT_189665 [Helobdella robusta]